MNKFLVSVLLILATLSGCSTTPRPYDSIEYLANVSVTVDTTRAIHECHNRDRLEFYNYLHQANSESMLLDEFAKGKSDSTKLITAVDIERSMFNEIIVRGDFSESYCVEKLTNIQAVSRILARVDGGSGNFNMCDGGIKERYTLFSQSYANGDITVSEYKELVTDVLKLDKVDTSGCSIESKRKLLDDLQFIESIAPTIMKL
jgi:hypothetical protein